MKKPYLLKKKQKTKNQKHHTHTTQTHKLIQKVLLTHLPFLAANRDEHAQVSASESHGYTNAETSVKKKIKQEPTHQVTKI